MQHLLPPKKWVTNYVQNTKITLPTTGEEHSSCLIEHNNTAKSFLKELNESTVSKRNYRGGFKNRLQPLSLESGQDFQGKHSTPFQFFFLKHDSAFDPMICVLTFYCFYFMTSSGSSHLIITGPELTQKEEFHLVIFTFHSSNAPGFPPPCLLAECLQFYSKLVILQCICY